MKKNNKGYLLAETIIAITVVATIITIIYSLTTLHYVTQDNDITKYNTVQGLYTAKDINKYFLVISENDKQIIDNKVSNDIKSAYIDLTDNIDNNNGLKKLCNDLDIDKIYLSTYDMTDLIENEKFLSNIVKRQIIKINEDNEKSCKYRYLITYKNNTSSSKKNTYVDGSYAIIGVNCYE